MVELIRGKDGKRYPVARREPADRKRLATLTHHMRCDRRLSWALVQETLAAEFGVRRSVGAIANDLRGFRCPLCASGAEPPTVPGIRRPRPPAAPRQPPAPPAPPAPRVKSAAFDWR